jgi:hypothetical protein
MADSAPETPQDKEKPRSKPWWEVMLVYPTLVVAIISAVPTYIELIGSKMIGVPFGNYKAAVKENELWQENRECAAAPFDGLATAQKIEVDAVICATGDVLVRIKPPGAKPKYKWVPLETVHSQSTGLITPAFAGGVSPKLHVAQGNFVVICQRFVANGVLRRRVHDRAANRCFDETVNTFNGQVTSVTPAPCSPQC